MKEELSASWILFDLSGVIAQMFWGPKTEFEINGKTVTRDQLAPLYQTDSYRSFMLGEIDEEKRLQNFLQESQLPLSPDELRQIFKQGQFFIDEIEDLLEELAKIFHLAILTNEGYEWVQLKVKSLRLERFFEAVIESNELGVLKPEEEFFIKALEELRIQPNECKLFVDDQRKNCETAEKLGIPSAVFENTNLFKEKLSERKIWRRELRHHLEGF